MSAYTKKYRVIQNGIPLDEQLDSILREIEKTHETDLVEIKIDGGYYSVTRIIEIQGLTNRVVIRGSKRNPTIISGSIMIEGWEVMPDGLWRCRLPEFSGKTYIPDQLFVNGKRAQRSQIPNDTTFDIVNGARITSTDYGASLKKKDIAMIPSIGEDEIPLLTIYRKWTAAKRFLKNISDTTLYFSGLEFPSYIKLSAGNGLIVENTRGGIDKPGEWCVDKCNYIYYMPKEGEIIGVTEFRIPILEKLLLIQTSDGVALRDIVFEHTTYQIPKDGIEDVQAGAEISAAIEVDSTSNLIIENCEFRNIANYGIWLRQQCKESKVIKCYFYDLGAGAIKVGTLSRVDLKALTKNIVVDNNIICRYGQLFESAVGIVLFNASDCLISHNNIHYGEYTGISLGWVWGFGDSPSKNNEVAYNKISHIGTGKLDDLGGIYLVGKSEGSSVHNNFISNIISKEYRGWGLFADEGVSGVVFENNLTYNCTSGGFHQNYGNGNIVNNNIFAWGVISQSTFSLPMGEVPVSFTHNIVIMESGALFTGCYVSPEMTGKVAPLKNCYWSMASDLPMVNKDDVLEWIKKSDTTSVFQNPNFRAPYNMDFRLKSTTISRVIGFKPFDYTKAGVYGGKKWKKLAETVQR